MKFLSIKIRFTINGYIYSFVWSWLDGFEIVLLDGNYDRPEIIKTLYAGHDVRVAGMVIRGLVG